MIYRLFVAFISCSASSERARDVVVRIAIHYFSIYRSVFKFDLSTILQRFIAMSKLLHRQTHFATPVSNARSNRPINNVNDDDDVVVDADDELSRLVRDNNNNNNQNNDDDEDEDDEFVVARALNEFDSRLLKATVTNEQLVRH